MAIEPSLPTHYSKPSPTIVTCWAMTETEMASLKKRLLNQTSVLDIFTTVYDKPIDNIVSCRVYPFDVKELFDYPDNIGDSLLKINCKTFNAGGFESTQVLACPVSVRLSSVSYTAIAPFIDFGYLHGKFANDSFLDLAPYTKVSLYLPYMGTIDIDPAEIVGDVTLYLKYAFDPYTGDATAFLYGGKSETIIATKSAKLGYEIPLVQGRDAQTAVNVATTLVGAAASIAATAVTKTPTPAVLGTLASVGTGLVGALNTRNERTGQVTAATSFYAPQQAFFIVEKQQSALPADPSIFNATVGRACCKTGTLSTFHGFTKCSAFHLDGFLNALDSELEEIDSLLRSGIILPASE